MNRVFYPHATTSLERLANHWYVRTQITRSRRKIGHVYFDVPGDRIQPQWTAFDPSIEAALKRVVLWDWRPTYLDPPAHEFDGRELWEGFQIPFVTAEGAADVGERVARELAGDRASDDPFHRPRAAPPVGDLYYEPVTDGTTGEELARPLDGGSNSMPPGRSRSRTVSVPSTGALIESRRLATPGGSWTWP